VADTDSQQAMRGVGELSLAERVQRLDDLATIRGICLTYGVHLDNKDWEPYAELFSESGGFAAAIGTVTGREAIRTLFDTTLKNIPRAFHVFSEPVSDVSGDRAEARSMWIYIRTGEDGWPEMLQFGHYDDTFVREGDGRWLFEHRQVTRDVGSAPYER
jgi:ketosteroid isomerase-like protein